MARVGRGIGIEAADCHAEFIEQCGAENVCFVDLCQLRAERLRRNLPLSGAVSVGGQGVVDVIAEHQAIVIANVVIDSGRTGIFTNDGWKIGGSKNKVISRAIGVIGIVGAGSRG